MAPGGSSLDDRYAINAAKTALREGYNSADVEQILSVFADGFTDMTAGLPTFFGVDAKTILRAKLEGLFRDYEVNLTPIIVDIAIAENLAVEYGWHELTIRPKAGGPPEVRRTRYSEIWNRDSNLAWHIVFVMDNADQEPELVEELLFKLKAEPGAL